jgi:hypothetical protein
MTVGLSGDIELSTLEEGLDWSSHIDIVDILFDLQQALTHRELLTVR